MAYHKKKQEAPADEPVTVDVKSEPTAVNVTWLGEGEDGPSENTWRGITFKKGEPTPVSNPTMIAKARNNRFYEVAG